MRGMHGPLKFDMSLEEAMLTQRAIRRLKDDPVDDALVLHLIELALKAPTGSNAQNWEFVVVRDPIVKGKLARLNRGAWRLYGGGLISILNQGNCSSHVRRGNTVARTPMSHVPGRLVGVRQVNYVTPTRCFRE